MTANPGAGADAHPDADSNPSVPPSQVGDPVESEAAASGNRLVASSVDNAVAESTTASTAGAISESTAVTPTRRQLVWRWAARLIAVAAVAMTVMMIALAIGMRANDSAIDAHLGISTATVISMSPLRTGIEFVDITGATIRPEGGVLYPGLLSMGQQFVVEYSTTDPQIARVAGRTASVGTLMIALTMAITMLVAVPVIIWFRRRSRLPLLGFRRVPGHASAMGTVTDA